MNIRPICESDRANVLEILAKTMSMHYMHEMRLEFEQLLEGKGYAFVADQGYSVLGYITCHQTAETFKLETLAVSPHVQGQGLGRLLVEHLEQALQREVPLRPLVINVVTDDAADDPVQAFYKKLGFVQSGIVVNEYKPGDRQVHLCKIIQ